MNYTFERLEKSRVKFNYVADAQDYDGAVVAAYAKTKHKYSVPGFRKGHAPRKVIEGMYGPYVFFSDAVNELADKALMEIEKNGEFELVSADSLDDVDVTEDGGVKFSLTVSVMPKVELGQYKGLALEKPVPEKVEDKDVDAYISAERQKQARYVEKDADATAEMGDIVNLDFVGRVNGEEFEGGKAQGHDLELGSHSFIPGFEEQLVGVKAGEVKIVSVVFPEDYSEASLAGKAAEFECTINGIKSVVMPEIDDEFVKDVSEFDTLDEYKASVRQQLEHEAEHRAEHAFEDMIVEAVVDNATVDIPDALIRREQEDMVEQFAHRLAENGLKLDDYLKYINMDREQFAEQYKEQAEKRVKVRLVMEAIVVAEDLKISDEEIDAELQTLAEGQSMTLEEFKKGLRREHIDYIVNSILSDKLMTLLKQENSGEAKPAKKPAAKKKAAKKPEEAEAEPSEEAKEESEAEAKPAAKPAKKSAPKAEAEEGEAPAKKKAPSKKTAKTTAPKDDAAE